VEPVPGKALTALSAAADEDFDDLDA